MRRALAFSMFLVFAFTAPACAQEWRPFEVTLPQGLVNDGIERQRRAAEQARRIPRPEPEPANLSEAWDRLVRSLAELERAGLGFAPGRITLDARVRVFALVGFTRLGLRFELEPVVTAPNVLELRVVACSEQWGDGEWEEQSASGISFNAGRLVDQLNAEGELAGKVHHVRGRGGELDRITIDLGGVPQLDGHELLELRPGWGELSLVGRTRQEEVTFEVTAGEINDGLRAARSSDAMRALEPLMGHGSWLDVGYENPGRITLHGRADLPWLPETSYRAVFRLERSGPQQVKLVLEDVHVGGDTLDGFLRSRMGAGVKRWLMNKIYDRLDAEEPAIAAAYQRGDLDVRVSHDPARREVRLIDLRPGTAAGVTIRPGYEVQDIQVVPGRIRITARLTPADDFIGPPAPPASAPSRGITGALSDAAR